MPRFTNFQSIRNARNKKKLFSGFTKYNIIKKRNLQNIKNISVDIRSKKCSEFGKVLKISAQDVFGFSLIPNQDSILPGTIFGFTQKRNCCWAKKPGEEKMWDEGPRVVIIGAGLSGLSAANHFVDNGFNNFQIFEASPRLGGRIHTAKFSNGGTCELGGEWLSGGGVNNGLIMLANQEGLLLNVDWRYNRKIVCLTSEGRALSSDLCAAGRRIFNKVRKEAHRLFRVASKFKHGTLSYFLDRRLEEELRGMDEPCDGILQRLMLALKNDLRVRWGAELSKMSSDLLGTFADDPGDGLRLKGGLVNALLPLVRKIPSNKIHLSSPVRTVFWGNNKTSVVLEGNVEIPCDYVIITVPLGFLKKNYENFFHPKLPKAKCEAIENIGFGTATKIIMKYQNEFWGKRRTEISTLWKTRDWSDRESYWYKGISCIHVQGNTASVTVGGPEALYVEDESPEVLAHDLTALLRCFTGASFIPMPQELLKSTWNTDSWHNGTGSYMTLDTRPIDPVNLAKPISVCGEDKPKLVFAGEATCADKLNTLQGARSAGIREAQRILNIVMASESTAAETVQ